MQAARTHQPMVRQEKADPRKRQSGPCTRNILSIHLKRSCTRESQHRVGRRNRRALQPPQKWDRGRKRKIHRPRTGFLKGPKLAALVRVLHLRKMYISRFNSVTMPFDLHTFKGKVEERALVDSGATANFIDYKTVASVTIPAATPEVPRDASSGHVPLGPHVIHPRAPSSRPMPRDPASRPRWVRLRESPPSTPDAPDEPESSTDPRIDSAVMTEDLSILQGLLSGLPMSLWSTVMDIDGH